MKMAVHSDDRRVGKSHIRGYRVERYKDRIVLFAVNANCQPISSHRIDLPDDPDYMAGILACLLQQFSETQLSMQVALSIAVEFYKEEKKEITYG